MAMTPEEFQHAVGIGEKVAALKSQLGTARYNREHLDYGPLIVRMNDDVRDNNRDRMATPEEVAKWKAEADAEIKRLEEEIARLLQPPT